MPHIYNSQVISPGLYFKAPMKPSSPMFYCVDQIFGVCYPRNLRLIECHWEFLLHSHVKKQRRFPKSLCKCYLCPFERKRDCVLAIRSMAPNDGVWSSLQVFFLHQFLHIYPPQSWRLNPGVVADRWVPTVALPLHFVLTFYFMCSVVCSVVMPACMATYYMFTWCQQSPEDMVGSWELEVSVVMICLLGAESLM